MCLQWKKLAAKEYLNNTSIRSRHTTGLIIAVTADELTISINL
jgi:hypothetical protein